MKKAFTLAEVLITLGVIGVVGAMTMPVLIQKYQKYVLAKNFKVVYSTLLNAIQMAEVDYGNSKYWQYSDDSLTVEQNSRLFSEKYLIPYLKDIDVYNEYMLHNCKNIIYKGRDGVTVSCNSVIGFCGNCSAGSPNLTHIHLPNGAIVAPMVRARSVYGNAGGVEIDVDINGYKGPNTLGRDVFRFWMSTYNHYKLGAYYGTLRSARDVYLQNCKVDHWTCTALVLIDGFKFSDDYPW